MRIIHISDIHWRGLSRHDEYKRSFLDFFETSKKLNPDIIYIGGDIVHSKTQGISPELIDSLVWWFTELEKICPVHIILGNHDGLILNKHRQDAISPIISCMNNKNIHLYKKSGVYPTGVKGFNWCVYSCFDEENWSNVKPESDDIHIGLFHGGVVGSLTDINWNIEGEVNSEFFKDCDFAMLGDIHKFQYLDTDHRIAYPGSSIQQNYGEDVGKGFLFWEIESKDKFTSTFYEIKHDRPFVTVDWAGTIGSTLAIAKTFDDHSRFRIRSDEAIQQSDIDLLYARLKSEKSASEIVFKIDQAIEPGIIEIKNDSFFKEDLRDSNTHKRLMRSYYENMNLSSEDLEKLDDLISKYTSSLSKAEEPIRNVRWSIKNLRFDNTFAYGKNNVVNLENLNGITGIFGRNRSGKSSIVGTLMYSLFNTSDRGSIKNIHIVNARKRHCLTEVEFNANGIDYRVDRQTVKHQTRKGDVYASTGLNLCQIDSDGNEVKDLNGEQRRETEKELRKIIGTADDFLLTSLASQGEMNTFLKEKATSRKAILSKFLDLNVFENMVDLAKDESSHLRLKAKSYPTSNWEDEILKLDESLIEKRDDASAVDTKLNKKRKRIQELQIEIATSPDSETIFPQDIKNQNLIIKEINSSLTEVNKSIEKYCNEISLNEDVIDKIESVRDDFPIQEISEKLDLQRNLEKTLITTEHEYDYQKTSLANMKKSVKKLLEVPCGDSFPKCKFIKDSHSNKLKIVKQEETLATLNSQLKASRKVLKTMEKEEFESQIKKYNELMQKMNQEKVKISNLTVSLNHEEVEMFQLTNELEDAKDRLADMKLRVVDDTPAVESTRIKNRISDLSREVKKLDSDRVSIAEKIGQIEMRIKKLKSDKKEYEKVTNQLKIFDLFIQAVSKRGIPKQIISSQLPVINSEISKILQSVAGFTVELEADIDSNSMDIFINYGDSKRVIELASGMEKMLSSLAIRVALINISSLPKTDLLIIDEGFGALDETNVEVCGQLLQSLKKWFKNIIIISHVDAIKDTVDNILDITWSGTNASVRYE